MILADFFRKKPSSGNVAKDRLKLVLVSDRANCSPDIMEQIKNDIIGVLQKYLEIDQEGLDIKISQTELDGDGTVPALFANIPIKDMKTEARNKIERNKNKNTEDKSKDNSSNNSKENKSSSEKNSKQDNSKDSKKNS